MKLEGVIHCEGPGCEHHSHVGIPSMQADRLPPGWIKVVEMGDQEPTTFGFCCWNCVLKFAAEFEPPTIIPWDQALGTDDEGTA